LPKLEVSEARVRALVATVTVRVNAALALGWRLGSGTDVKQTVAALVGLFLVSKLGGLCTFATLAYLRAFAVKRVLYSTFCQSYWLSSHCPRHTSPTRRRATSFSARLKLRCGAQKSRRHCWGPSSLPLPPRRASACLSATMACSNDSHRPLQPPV